MSVVAHLETAVVPVTPGAQAQTEIRVGNTGKIVDQLTIDVVGDAKPWSVADPPALSLLPGDENTARIIFSPPRAPHVVAGPLPFGVRVRSSQDPASSVVEEGVLHVEPFFEAAADLSPRTLRARGGAATYGITVENAGNSPIDAAIIPQDPERQLEFDAHPPILAIGAGEWAAARLLVRPRERFWVGPPRTHAFRVLLETPGLAAIPLDGTLTQEAQLPPWATRVAPTIQRGLALLLRSLPILLFVGVLVPLAVRLAMQLVNQEGQNCVGSSARVGGVLGDYTDFFVRPFLQSTVPTQLETTIAPGLCWELLIISTTWQVFVALLFWGVIWLLLAALSRLFRR